MTWAVGLALVAVAVVAVAAWLLARPRPEPFDAEEGAVHRAPDGFAPQLRGYRMDQVDAVVDALEARIAAHDGAIATLRRGSGPPPAPAGTATEPAGAADPSTAPEGPT